MNTSIVQGSIGAIAQRDGVSIAESFVNADVVIIVDTSGSMGANDSRNGMTRYSVACQELEKLQQSLPGKLALLSFSDDIIFCPNGIPFNYQGGTDLAKALKFAKLADVPGIRFIVISDGEPDNEAEALKVAKTYKARIDTIYVGPENGSGAEFLQRLAKASGGQGVTTAQAKELTSTVKHLLTA